MTKLALICTAVAVAALNAGCVSADLTDRSRTSVTAAMTKAQEHLQTVQPVQSKSAIEQSQEVNAPYIVGRSVPLSRAVTLPHALQKGVKTAIMFPERWVSLSTAAERIMMATGIVVTIAPDVYLDNSALMRKNAKDSGAAAGAGPSAQNPLPAGTGPLPMPTPIGQPIAGNGAGGASAQRPQESAAGFDFPRVEAPLSQILDLVATRLGILWKYDDSTGSIRLYRLVTKSWATPFSSANSAYTTILDGGTSSSSNANAVSAKSSAAPISTKGSELNELNAIRDSVDTVMTRSGAISANPATGTITLTDTSEAVDAADEMIRREIKILSRMVILRVQTIQVTSNDSGESGINLSAAIAKAMKNLPDLSLSLSGPASLTSASAGALGVNVLSGAASGSQVVMKALSEVGDVQTSTEIPLSTRNRHAIYYNVRNVFSYVSATTPAAATTGGTGGTPGITTAQDSVGLKLVMYPNVISKDNVMLTMALDQSILQSLNTFSSGSGANLQSVQLPNVNGEGSSQEVPIRNGETIVLTGFDRVANQYDKRTLGDKIPVIAGGSVRASQTRATTIVLVSVQIKDID